MLLHVELAKKAFVLISKVLDNWLKAFGGIVLQNWKNNDNTRMQIQKSIFFKWQNRIFQTILIKTIQPERHFSGWTALFYFTEVIKPFELFFFYTCIYIHIYVYVCICIYMYTEKHYPGKKKKKVFRSIFPDLLSISIRLVTRLCHIYIFILVHRFHYKMTKYAWSQAHRRKWKADYYAQKTMV